VTAGLTLAHLVAVVVFLGDRNGLRITHDLAGWAASISGVVGTVAAARAFSRGDHLRRVWTLFATGSSLLLVGTALRSYWTHAAPFVEFYKSPFIFPRLVAVGGANLASTCGLILLVSTYARSGLKVPRSPRFMALWSALSAVALLLMLRQMQHDVARFGDAATQVAFAMTNVLSTVGDTTTIILIAPVLRIAYLMRGGRLASVWWAMGLSGAVWLVYDCREWIAALLPQPAQALEVLKVLRTPGLVLVGLAGLRQQDAVK
jgi:hypothetical protein